MAAPLSAALSASPAPLPLGPGEREVPDQALGTFPAGVLASQARVLLQESVGIHGFLGPCVYVSPLARGARFSRSLTSVQQSWCFGRAGTLRLPSDAVLRCGTYFVLLFPVLICFGVLF